MTVVFIVLLALSVLVGALVKCAVERRVLNENGKCLRCGELGWVLIRKDLQSCHAKCSKCGWVSHFDTKHWQRAN
jgi:transcription elongation factor Elf1